MKEIKFTKEVTVNLALECTARNNIVVVSHGYITIEKEYPGIDRIERKIINLKPDQLERILESDNITRRLSEKIPTEENLPF